MNVRPDISSTVRPSFGKRGTPAAAAQTDAAHASKSLALGSTGKLLIGGAAAVALVVAGLGSVDYALRAGRTASAVAAFQDGRAKPSSWDCLNATLSGDEVTRQACLR
jgi:hypothetical protein